jgi:hypothetical protein
VRFQRSLLADKAKSLDGTEDRRCLILRPDVADNVCALARIGHTMIHSCMFANQPYPCEAYARKQLRQMTQVGNFPQLTFRASSVSRICCSQKTAADRNISSANRGRGAAAADDVTALACALASVHPQRLFKMIDQVVVIK